MTSPNPVRVALGVTKWPATGYNEAQTLDAVDYMLDGLESNLAEG
jgi:hypothetical protein